MGKRGFVIVRSSNRSGFTLIEVMVSLVLLVLGALSIAMLSLMIAQANRGSTDRTRAFQLMYDKIEEFQSETYSDVVDGSDQLTLGGVRFSRAWTIQENDPVDEVKRVEITATWSDKGVARSVTTAAFVGAR